MYSGSEMTLFPLDAIRNAWPDHSLEPAIEEVRSQVASFPFAPDLGTREEVLEAFDMARPRLNVLAHLVHAVGAHGVLDIGTGLGFLPVLLQALGMAVEATERDLSISDFAVAQGVPVVPWTLGQGAEVVAGEFDVVILGEVLEHIKAPPGRVIREASAPLSFAGTFLLSTPNIARSANIEMLAAGENFLEAFPEEIPLGADATDWIEHVREYSVREVVDAIENAGLGVNRVLMTGWGERGYVPPANPWINDLIVAVATR